MKCKRLLLAIVLIMLATAGPWAWAQTEQTIYNFNCATDGCGPYAGLTWGGKNLYGTTSSAGPGGDGTVFELSPSKDGWNYQVIFSFNNTTTGKDVYSNLTYYKGALYGAANGGGEPPCACGVLFELKKVKGVWTETILHDFEGGATDGSFPRGGVAFDSKGNIYGTTAYGGTAPENCGPGNGCGTVYELSKVKGKWQFSVLYSFQGSAQGGPYDGAEPYATPAIDGAGNLYGTTCCEGTNGGNVWELSPAGGGKWNYQNWFFFNGTATGYQPNAGVILDSHGNLYGTVAGSGTAFEMTGPSPLDYNLIYSQEAGKVPDVIDSYAPLVFDSSGNLYGTTYTYGDGDGDGTVFELASPDWVPTILYIFPVGGADGSGIQSAVTVDKKGNVYGTASGGGSLGGGVIFEISP